ncbi:hypothetical protein Hdeb2414_s0005g00158531 [Helianthus debilis subsp. tardiflorus]
MTRRRRSWMNELLPFVAMLMTTCLDMGGLTLVKAAMDGGLPIIVYIVYHSALGTFILLPFFIIHIYRLCLYQILGYVGVYYSSPTMASALGNLTPAVTFVTSIIFRMEKIDMRSSVSVAKLSGTIITICGAMVFTFYQGPQLFVTIRSPASPDDQILLSQPSNWVFGGLMIFIGGTFGCIWNVLQVRSTIHFLKPDQLSNCVYHIKSNYN